MKKRSDGTKRDRKAGFTLIEVLLVVVIIGILVGVAVPKLGGKVKKAQISRTKADVQQIGLACRLFEVDNGSYPPSLTALMSNPGKAPGWDGPYLEQGIPKDPWGNEYIYASPGSINAHSYDLKSYGPDGTDSADDIGNFQKSGQ